MKSTEVPSDSDDHVQQRPAKRQRRLEDGGGQRFARVSRRLIVEELDLEIALRQRLFETAQSRITWALLLQEALEKELKAPSFPSSDFRSAAETALTAIEEPCAILFDRENRWPSPPPFAIISPERPSPVVPEIAPQSSPIATRQGALRSRIRARVPLQPAQKLLFLRYTHTTPPTIAKLACPDCARSDFSNLQGLLNHCRLRHQREFGSHDECVQSCAVLVPEDERDLVIGSGTELKGITLPSLRRLFEIAVGAISGAALLPLPLSAPVGESPDTQASVKEVEPEPRAQSSHLTRTLGHHLDTPALAPFLGRVPQKRFIRVHDENESVDIFNASNFVPSSGPQRDRTWRMPFSHRNSARREVDEDIVSPAAVNDNKLEKRHPGSGNADQDNLTQEVDGSQAESARFHSLSGSRFHVAARITIADHSLWLPPERRPEHAHDQTHQWRVSVSSPSYSLHITAVLAKLTVQCITDPPPPTFLEPIILTEPPFSASGLSDSPFLARLNFVWADDKNAPMDIDHWVDLDPIHSVGGALGDEQVFDIELDRYTQLLPIRENCTAITWDDNISPASRRQISISSTEQTQRTSSDFDYAEKLRSLLPQVPMTMKDVKGRGRPNLSYTLLASPAQLQSVVFGRRKAIEMGRARALRDAYQRLIEERPQEDAIPLTVFEVYRWLEDEQLFLRSDEKQSDVISRLSRKTDFSVMAAADAFCARCGLRKGFHSPPVKGEDSGASNEQVTPAVPFSLEHFTSPCTAFVEVVSLPPILDIKYLLGPSTMNAHPWSPYPLTPAVFTSPSGDGTLQMQIDSLDLVACADPCLISSMEQLARRWEISCLQLTPSVDNVRGSGTTLADRAILHRPKSETLDRVAPYAMLALLTRSFMKFLIHRGMESFRQDETASSSLQNGPRRHVGSPSPVPPSGAASPSKRLLTPSHIFRGLACAARTEVLDSATLIALSRLGESVHSEVAIGMGNIRTSSRKEAPMDLQSEPLLYDGENTRSSVTGTTMKSEER